MQEKMRRRAVSKLAPAAAGARETEPTAHDPLGSGLVAGSRGGSGPGGYRPPPLLQGSSGAGAAPPVLHGEGGVAEEGLFHAAVVREASLGIPPTNTHYS